jgi:hypothetical protein
VRGFANAVPEHAGLELRGDILLAREFEYLETKIAVVVLVCGRGHGGHLSLAELPVPPRVHIFLVKDSYLPRHHCFNGNRGYTDCRRSHSVH